MGDASRPLPPRETALLVLDAAGGKVESRTTMQKLGYFSGLAIQSDLDYRPYSYGPYSRELEEAIGTSVIASDIEETVKSYASWQGGHYVRGYTYTLTEQGRQEVASIKKMYPDKSEQVEKAIAAIRSVIVDLDQKWLSRAAKIHLILLQQGRPLDQAEIPALASELDRRLSSDEVAKTVEVLKGLHLVEEVDV